MADKWATITMGGVRKAMAIQIGAKPDSGFDDPIGMLKDCHRRVESFLDILCVVAGRAANRNLTDEEGAAIQAALQYFRTGGQRHTADEEESLFPRLRACAAGSLQEIDRLEADHQEAGHLHESVEQLYSALIESGELEAEKARYLLAETARLKQLYSDHIEVEEKVVFVRAAEALDEQTIAAIGTEFRFRRK
jgi:hemerythrin-like domain-containing protein